jgi:predicted Fe-Mo cluster-binding NifX family protein
MEECMKVLVASEGSTLESPVAKRFGGATWYLIVDVETETVNPIQNLEREDHHDIVPKAASEGVTTIVTGNIGPRSYELISSHKLRVAHCRSLSGHEALARLKRGELKILDAPTLQRNVEEHELLLQGRREQFARGRRSAGGKGTASRATPRGRHHLQQYGGRGH